MTVREATHAGSWYTDNGKLLSSQLDGWLEDVQPPVNGIAVRSVSSTLSQFPVPGARIIIAPHAGYSYSGPAAAWAYKAWDVSKAKRVFLLGPSHHFYMTNAALSQCTAYATPLGNLTIDKTTISTLFATGSFSYMQASVDADEHSLEMHLPYIHKMLSRVFPAGSLPPLVPIMVGNTSASTERAIGEILAPYLADPENAFVVSSDFCHWGSRFRYTYFRPAEGAKGRQLRSGDRPERAVHESIREVDFECMDACETGKHKEWTKVLESTGNTVCGRHPIGVIMAGLEAVMAETEEADGDGKGLFNFVRYERSSLVSRLSDSSVSYASAYAVL